MTDVTSEHDGTRRTSKTMVALALVVALVLAACGTKLSDDERALFAGNQTSSDGAASGGGSVTGAGSGTATNSGVTTTTLAGTAGGGSVPQTATDGGGTATGGGTETGGGDTGGGVDTGGGAAPAPGQSAGSNCAQSANGAPGVTAEAITVGGVFQLSGAVPGFAQGAVDGAQAYVAYVNSTGGICGRQLVFEVADDAFDSARHAAEAKRIEPNLLAFSSGYSTVDQAIVPLLDQVRIPIVNVGAAADVRFHPNHYHHLKGLKIENAYATPDWKFVKANGGSKIALVYANVTAARVEAQLQGKNAEAAGLQVVLDREVSSTQFSYAEVARAVADSGADTMYFVHATEPGAQMARELAKVDHSLLFPAYQIGYGPKFLELAGDGAEGSFSFIEFIPFDEVGTNAELDLYLEWLNRVAPSSGPGFDSVHAWTGMKLLVEAIRAIDGDITRESLFESFAAIGEWNADGLMGPVNIGARTTQFCKVAVHVENGQWTRFGPASGFTC